jgi:hypothetical protein
VLLDKDQWFRGTPSRTRPTIYLFRDITAEGLERIEAADIAFRIAGRE